MEGDDINDVCSIGPSEELLKAAESNNVELFKKLLKCPSIDLNYAFREYYLGKILEVCCASSGKSEFVRELLSAGMDANCFTVNEQKAPIHFAVMNGHVGILNVLLDDPKIDINALDGDGNSALHLATIAGNVQCITLLLDSKGIKPNQLNGDGMTPAYIAATSSVHNNELVAASLRCSAVDFDGIVQNKTLKEVIHERYPHLVSFKYLYASDEEGFISYITSLKQYEGNDGKYTYLQYACKFGLPKVVKELLDHGVDPNERTEDYYDYLSHNNAYAFFIAATYGYAEIIQLFLDSKNPNIIYQMNGDNSEKTHSKFTYYTSALHLVIENSTKKLSTNHNKNLCDYDKSFKILLPVCSSLDVDFADSRGDTCLHSAAFIENRNYIHQLLDHGASLGKRNRFGATPLNDISLNTMRLYLDNCIHSNESCASFDDYEITFSYEFLCPSKAYKHIGPKKESPSAVVTKKIAETDQLFCLSELPKFKNLLQHPVLNTIIDSKWSQVQIFYLFNLIFYLNFLSYLTAYILSTFTKSEDPIRQLIGKFSWYLVFGCLIVLIVRELFQFTLSPKNYITTLENWLEINIIFITSILLCENSFEEYREPLCAIIIIVTWGEFILILGKHPKFAVPLAMFKLVSKNFLEFLIWYSILITAFILSFYVLFKNSEDDNRMFSSFLLSSFKTIIMLTGEFDASNLPFSSSQIISRIVFILFVFLIPIVLVNLLNGLAVSDTRKIQKHAEIIANVSRLQFIHSFETIILSKHVFRYFIGSLCIRLFDLNVVLFPDPGRKKLIIFANRRKYEFKRTNKICYEVNLPGFVVDTDVVNETKKKIASMSEKNSKNKEEDIKVLIEEIRQLKQMITAVEKH